MNEDKATRYNRLKRQVGVASVAWGLVFLLALTVSGGSLVLRDMAERLASLLAPASFVHTASVGIYVVLLTVLNELGAVPLSFYGGFVLERRYGLSKQPTSVWLADQAKSLALVLVLGVVAAGILYFFIGRYPVGWWLPAGAVFALLIVGLANLAPLLLLPLFYSVKPLARQSLRDRLVSLGERAGARVLDAYEWGLGEKTSRANAALTGIGGSRRILVSDTMLAEYSDDEIEVVLAHEIAHHVHGDIWKGLVFESELDRRRLLRCVVAAEGRGADRRPARSGRCCRPADSAARGWGCVAGHDAGCARAVTGARAPGGPFCADVDEATRRPSFRRCGALPRRTWRKTNRRRWCSGCSTAIRRFASGSPPLSPSNPDRIASGGLSPGADPLCNLLHPLQEMRTGV